MAGWPPRPPQPLLHPLRAPSPCHSVGSIRLPKAAKAPLKIHPLARLPLAAIVKELGEGVVGGGSRAVGIGFWGSSWDPRGGVLGEAMEQPLTPPPPPPPPAAQAPLKPKTPRGTKTPINRNQLSQSRGLAGLVGKRGYEGAGEGHRPPRVRVRGSGGLRGGGEGHYPLVWGCQGAGFLWD